MKIELLNDGFFGEKTLKITKNDIIPIIIKRSYYEDLLWMFGNEDNVYDVFRQHLKEFFTDESIDIILDEFKNKIVCN